jgi:hypothetical protein
MTDIYDRYLFREISGKEFNEIFKDRIFCKFLNNNLRNRHFQYVEKSLNINTDKFLPSGKCLGGGLYFFDFIYFEEYSYDYGNRISIVTIPNDARVYIEEKKIKADKIYLSETYKVDNIFNYLEWLEKNKKNEICDMNKIIQEITALNIDLLNFVDEKYKTYKFYLYLATKYYRYNIFCCIPKKYLTYKFYKNVVKEIPQHIFNIPKRFKKRPLWVLSLRQSFCHIRNIPTKYLDYNFYIDSIKLSEDSSSLSYVPDKYRDLNMCLISIKSNSHNYVYVSDVLKTQENLIKFVKNNPYTIDHIEEKYKTYELCLLLVKNDYDLIDSCYIPEKFKLKLDLHIFYEKHKKTCILYIFAVLSILIFLFQYNK